MTNVVSDGVPVNGPPVSLEEVIDWVEKQSAKADVDPTTARLRITGLKQMAEQIAEDEPKDAASLFHNLDRARERWARRNAGSKSDTAKTYAARAKAALVEYFRWSAAPDKYDPKRTPPKSEAPKKSKQVAQPPAAPVAMAAQAPAPAPLPKHGPSDPMDRIRLGGGRDLFVMYPTDGFFVKDALRSAYAMILACEDYDSSRTPMQVLAEALNGGS